MALTSETRTMLAVAAVLLAACGGANSYSPTAPPTPLPSPPPPTPTPVGGSLTAWYAVYPLPHSGKQPEQVQVLIDSFVVYTGPLVEPGPWDYSPGPYVFGEIGALAVGRHTLTLRLTRPAVSPETYSLYAELGIFHKKNGQIVNNQLVTSWHEEVTLATGDAWTGVFEIQEWRG